MAKKDQAKQGKQLRLPEAINIHHKIVMPSDPAEAQRIETLAISFSLFVVNVLVFLLSRIYGIAFLVFFGGFTLWLWWHVYMKSKIGYKKVIIVCLASIAAALLTGYVFTNYVVKEATVINKPTITLGRGLKNISTFDNQAEHSIVTKFDFRVANIGNCAAYQIQQQMCAVDGATPEIISSGKAAKCGESNVNPLQPQEEVIWTSKITTPYKEVAGARVYDVTTWFLYCKITYSDAEIDGTPYEVEYWYSYDLNKDTFASLTMEQKQQFRSSPIFKELP